MATRVFGIILLAVPSVCLAAQGTTKISPIASYDSLRHGLVVDGANSSSSFVVVFRNRAVQLRFRGSKFEEDNTEVPDEALLNNAAKSRERNLDSQTRKAFSHRSMKIVEMKNLKRFGYKVIQYSIPIYSGGSILANGGKIVITRNSCKMAWRTTNYAITSINIFLQESKIYLTAVMYAVRADGYTPSIKVFRLQDLCKVGRRGRR